MTIMHGQNSAKGGENVYEVGQQIIGLARQNNGPAIQQTAERFLASGAPAYQQYLIGGTIDFLTQNLDSALGHFQQAGKLMKEDEVPALDSLYTNLYLQVQQLLPKSQRPGLLRGEGYYCQNIEALRGVNAGLAAEIETADYPDDYTQVELWDGLYFYAADSQTLLMLAPHIHKELSKHIQTRTAIAFGGVGTGQEVRYCLKHQVDILHGMARPHYLFEPDISKIKALLHLDDLSSYLANYDLLVFGGSSIKEDADRVFGSGRYPIPDVNIGNINILETHLSPVANKILEAVPIEKVKAYYQSPAFAERLGAISRGQIQPRILVRTCRWTTFLKYCAADFDKAFGQLGCETLYIIEETDTQSLLPVLDWDVLENFKPDMVFVVSHSRQAVPYMPRELPFIGFIQDKCGPILRIDDLTDHISPMDYFVCMMTEFEHYLWEKKVPEDQTSVLPIPADESMFYPLEDDATRHPRFNVDVGFVKHGHEEYEKVFAHFIHAHTAGIEEKTFREGVANVFRALYEKTCARKPGLCYEGEMQEFVTKRLSANASEDTRNGMRQLVSQFYISVYSAAWRCQFLETLDAAGVELGLFGNGWNEHGRLKHLARGPVNRTTELNLVYNFNRINLSINHSTTMHQRLAECGLAGGFMMVADHPQDQDWEPARRYFAEDREAVFFADHKELVDKVRYYLEHGEARQEIAHQMYLRAREERTCVAAAKTILERWRGLLNEKL